MDGEEFSRLLEKRFIQYGWDVATLSEKSGLPTSTIYHLKKNKNLPDGDTLWALYKAFEIGELEIEDSEGKSIHLTETERDRVIRCRKMRPLRRKCIDMLIDIFSEDDF